MSEEHQSLRMIERPSNLIGVEGAYAMVVPDDTMLPRYEAGWLVHVNPVMQPVAGRDVIIVRESDRVARIWHCVKQQGGAIWLRKLNQPAMIAFAMTELVSCHVIVGCDQEPFQGN